jgi:peptide methionine sulfoxide reductase msrA/msrB
MTSTSTQRAIFASGCFWGTEYHLKKQAGVLSTSVGFTGGHIKNPAYREVCMGTTGHAEAVEVIFDPSIVSFESLARLFFETHDPTQLNRQGPDVGTQYRSEIFVLNKDQRTVSAQLIKLLEDAGLPVQTQITSAGPFYRAEEYHHDYYNKSGGSPYCHIYTKRFTDG